MTYRRFMLCAFGLAAWLWGIASASAHEPSTTPRPTEAESRPAFVPLSGNIPWDTIEWIERRYKIEAMHFKARDESGIDWWGSDEVMIETRDAKGWTVSDEFGDVDSGETHKVDPARSCIIAVRPGIVVLGKTSVCNDVGEPAPLWFEVEFWEKDIPFPFGFTNFVCGTVVEEHSGPHCVRKDGDDFIGHARIDLTQQDLDLALPHVGDEYIETVVLDPCPGAQCAGFADYSFTYRITRLPDVRVGLHGILDEAMRKIGARSELEAIAAGLRSLRAPRPRQIEPDTGRPETTK